MPYVQVKYRKGAVPDGLMVGLCDALPEIVAQALTCESDKLVASDVDVEMTPMAENFRTTKEFIVTVETATCPERANTLDDRTHLLVLGTRVYLSNQCEEGSTPMPKEGYVRVVLLETRSAEI